MVIAALVSAGCQFLVLGCFAFLAVRWYRRETQRLLEELSEAVREFVTAPDKDTPAPLAKLIDQGALLLAARLIQQLKAMLSGVESGASKGEQLALITEATADNPWLALIAGILPARIRNKLMRNPQMIGALSKLGAGGNHATDAAVSPVRHRE
jgi:hypothetical protein